MTVGMKAAAFLGGGMVVLALIGSSLLPSLWGQQKDAIARGEYVYRAAGGCTCHSDPAKEDFSLAGGRPIKTPFGRSTVPTSPPTRRRGSAASTTRTS